MAGRFVDMFVTGVIAVALLPVLTQFTSDAAVNQSAVVSTLLTLVPVLYIIVLVAAFAFAIKRRG